MPAPAMRSRPQPLFIGQVLTPCPCLCLVGNCAHPSLTLPPGVLMRQSGLGVAPGPVEEGCPPVPMWAVASDGGLALAAGCRARLPFALPSCEGGGVCMGLALIPAFTPSPNHDPFAQGSEQPLGAWHPSLGNSRGRAAAAPAWPHLSPKDLCAVTPSVVSAHSVFLSLRVCLSHSLTASSLIVPFLFSQSL